MKVIRDQNKKTRSVTLRIPEETMKQIDKVASENDISRQKLIAVVLEQALKDKSFVIRLED